MRVGIITPPKLLKYSTTKVHYCLPRFIEEDPRYRKFFIDRVRKDEVVILDLIKPGWKRTPESAEIIEAALSFITPTYTVLPSYMYNLEKTVRTARETSRLVDGLGSTLVPCIEGSTLKEIITALSMFSWAKTMAFPAHIYKVCTIDQLPVKSAIFIDNWKNIDELGRVKDSILVTSLPIRLGLAGRFLSDFSPAPPRLKFDEEDKFPAVIRKNIQEAVEHYEV